MRLWIKYLTIIYLVANAAILSSIFISPDVFWPVIFLNHLIAPIICLNIFLLMILLYLKDFRRFFIVVFLVIITIPLWKKIYKIPSLRSNELHSSFSLLSYNTKLFRAPGGYDKFSTELIDWVVNDTSMIKCIQEFSTNDEWKGIDVKSKIEDRGYHAFTYIAKPEIYYQHDPGLAIFSKYPILKAGLVDPSEKSVNAMIYADVLISTDTIRIYNIHLTSYRFDQIADDLDGIKWFLEGVRKIRSAVSEHSSEITELKKHMSEVKYPIIVTGDFNEIPFSYNYSRLSPLENAFDEKGTGFGLTVIKPPLYLRIDNVFFDDKIQVDQYLVDYSIQISDHFPQRFFFSIKD